MLSYYSDPVVDILLLDKTFIAECNSHWESILYLLTTSKKLIHYQKPKRDYNDI